MTTHFECFIAASIVQVKLCRQCNVHPLTYFDMQVREDPEFEEVFSGLRTALRNLNSVVLSTNVLNTDGTKRVKLTFLADRLLFVLACSPLLGLPQAHRR